MNRSDRVPASHRVGSLQGQGHPDPPRTFGVRVLELERRRTQYRALPRWMVVSGAATSDSRDTR